MLQRMIKKMLYVLLNKDKALLAPSSKEEKFLSELQTAFRELPVLKTKNLLPSEAEWVNNMNRLRELVLNHNPREFLRWNVISGTMFVSKARYILTELNYIKQRSDWDTLWRTAIKEFPTGHPLPYLFYPDSSGNLIHHAYHVAQFEEKTGAQIHNTDYVFEFGGGYGSMCRLFFNLGFHGKYIIFDLPSFSALQRYFLKAIGLPVHSLDTFIKSKTGVICLSDIEQLKLLIPDHIEVSNSMFIATWSISEAPITIRDPILSLTSEFKSFLLAYQDKFGEVNNVNFFSKWKDTNRAIIWHNWQIKHIPGNNYLVGKKADNS